MRRPFVELLGVFLCISLLGSRSLDAEVRNPAEPRSPSRPEIATPAEESEPAPGRRDAIVVRRGPLVVRAAPTSSSRVLGSLEVGAKVELRPSEVPGWFAVEPRGYVVSDPKLAERIFATPGDAPSARFEFVEASPGAKRYFSERSAPNAPSFFLRDEPLRRRSFFRVARHLEKGNRHLLELGDGSFIDGNAVKFLQSSTLAGSSKLPETREVRSKLDAGTCRRLFGQCPERLVEVAAKSGFLYLHERGRPVYFTRISAGRLGTATPKEGGRVPPGKTPLGVFSILSKHRLLTMTSPGSTVIHQDVPWTLHFSGPYALHVAYWHDDFGKPRSGGCVNLSPEDGKVVFDFSTPKLPLGWHSVSAQESGETPTQLWIHD